MLECVVIRVQLFPRVLGTLAFNEDPVGPPLNDPFRALDEIQATVGTGVVGVVADIDGLAFDGADQRHVDVAQLVRLVTARIRLGEVCRGVLFQAAVVRAHRNEEIEPIAAIDVHTLGDRSEPVRRVQVAVVRLRPGAAPQPLALLRELDLAQVVQISALAMQELAEHAQSHEMQCQHLAPVVATVLHHHAVLLELLGGVHEVPAIVYRHGGGNLGHGVLATLHRGEQHWDVPLPGRRREHQIQLLLGTHALEVARAAGVPRGLGLICRNDRGLRPRHFPVHDVADGPDFCSLDFEQVVHVDAALSPHADEADAYAVNRWGGKRNRAALGGSLILRPWPDGGAESHRSGRLQEFAVASGE